MRLPVLGRSSPSTGTGESGPQFTTAGAPGASTGCGRYLGPVMYWVLKAVLTPVFNAMSGRPVPFDETAASDYYA